MSDFKITDKVTLKRPYDGSWTNCNADYGENPTPIDRLCTRKTVGEVIGIDGEDYLVRFEETKESYDFRSKELNLVNS
jgi:hypothetical protein